MRTLKKTVVLSLSSLLVATAWSGCGTSNPEVEDTNSGGLTPGDGDAGTDASSGDGDEGPMFPGGDGDGDGLGPGGPGGPGDGDGDGDGDSDAAVIIPRDYPDATFSYTPPVEDGGSCADITADATLTKRPMDIIISIDNSGSMEGEIVAVQQRINDDFAAIIDASEIDYRVILVSRYGWVEEAVGLSNFPVCIGPPLGNAACVDSNYPVLAHNSPVFFHHSTDIGSNNMWCYLTESYDASDEYPTSRSGWTPVATMGWQEWLRPEAFKVFIGITDDNPEIVDDPGDSSQQCPNATDFTNDLAGAEAFDEALRTLAPEQFGSFDSMNPDANRNYRWYSIIGLAPKASPDETVPYEPTEAIVTTICNGPDSGSSNDDGVGAGAGYQYLSQMTGGLRYSNCLNDDFDAIFNAIAEGVIEGAVVNCDFEIPDPASGDEINFDNVTVTYLEGGNTANGLNRVNDVGDCAGDDEYYLGVQGDAGGQDFNRVFLCPDTCTRVQADADAEISVGFGCLGQ
ncbi:MAG TPA: hypothetical protein VHO25_04045 [Polyangiaceae bacterium]|nr:hypothetical protein [Polyangiaceae bacterium]